MKYYLSCFLLLVWIFLDIGFIEAKQKSDTSYLWFVEKWYTLVEDKNLDINGDGVNEKLITYISARSDRWKLRILSYQWKKWKVIKQDEAWYGKWYIEKNPFFLQVYDFGSDGKEEVIVSKRPGHNFDVRDENKSYYVFGFSNGTYGDFPIPKGYLHPEWFPEYLPGVELKELHVHDSSIDEVYRLAPIASNTGTSMSQIQYDAIQVHQTFQDGWFSLEKPSITFLRHF